MQGSKRLLLGQQDPSQCSDSRFMEPPLCVHHRASPSCQLWHLQPREQVAEGRQLADARTASSQYQMYSWVATWSSQEEVPACLHEWLVGTGSGRRGKLGH